MEAYFKRALIILCALALFGCSKESPKQENPTVTPEVKITTPDVSIKSSDLSGSVAFYTNKSWEAGVSDTKGAPSWIDINPKKGSAGNNTINITISEENKSYDDRCANITITSDTVKRVITVTQTRKITIITNQKLFDLDPEAHEITVSSQSNCEYDINITSSWITNATTKALQSNSHTFKIEQNTSTGPREGKIIFISKQNKQVSDTAIIRQQYIDPVIPKERAALVAIYNALGGDNWTKKANWCSDKPVGEWEGVKTDGNGYITELNFAYNNLSGTFPDEIAELANLSQLYIYNSDALTQVNLCAKAALLPNLRGLYLDKIKIPAEFWVQSYNLNKLTRLSITSKINIANPEFIPKSIWSITSLENLDIFGCKIELTPEIGNLSGLKSLSLFGINIENEFPSSICNCTSLKRLEINYGFNCSGENATHLTTHMSGSIPEEIGNLVNLEYCSLAYNDLTGSIPSSISRLNKLTTLKLSGNRLSGKIPTQIQSHPSWNGWDPQVNIYPQQNGYGLAIEVEESQDFSMDGEVHKLHSSTKPQGIEIVIVGDGFIDKDMSSGGKYEQIMQRACDYFLNIEPYKSYKEYFDIYYIKAVSKQKGISDNNTTIETKFSVKKPDYTSTSLSINLDKTREFVSSLGHNEKRIIVVSNTTLYAGTCFFNIYNGDAKTVAVCTLGEMENVLHHEANGHGFGLLADEYITYNSSMQPEHINTLQYAQQYGLWPNIDFTSDRTKIIWRHFFDLEGYNKVGAYEGAHYYRYGVWRPEESSCMVDNRPYFNAPSREAIVKQIKKLSGETFSFTEFLQKDKNVQAPAVTKSTIILPPLGAPVVKWEN